MLARGRALDWEGMRKNRKFNHEITKRRNHENTKCRDFLTELYDVVRVFRPDLML